MTQKHYRLFAAMLKTELDEITARQASTVPGGIGDHEAEAKRLQITIIANRMANIFAEDNPRFKRAMFLKACGLES